MKVRTRNEKSKELVAKAIKELEGVSQDEIFDEVLNEETRAYFAREQIFDKLTPKEKAEPETREWFDNLNWNKFTTHFRSANKQKEEIRAYLDTENFSNDEKVHYLSTELSRCKKQIVKSKIGIEILTNYTLGFYLQLFSDTPGLIIENDAGKEFDFEASDIGKLSEELAEYGAYEEVLNEFGPTVPPDPHLKDIARTEDQYNAIIKVLVEEEIIDKDSHKWIVTKKYSIKFIGNFIRLLHYKDFYKCKEITDSIVQSVVKNTFGRTIGIRFSKGGDYTEPELKRVVKTIQERLSKKS